MIPKIPKMIQGLRKTTNFDAVALKKIRNICIYQIKVVPLRPKWVHCAARAYNI